MIKACYVTLSFLLWFTSTVHAQGDQERKTLFALAQARSKALINGDSVAMKQILDEDFYYVNSQGVKRNRQEYLRNMYLPGDSKWLGQEIDSMDIRFITPEVAVLNFVVLDSFRYEGAEYDIYNRSTFVYGKRKGKWKCLLGHTSEIGEKKD